MEVSLRWQRFRVLVLTWTFHHANLPMPRLNSSHRSLPILPVASPSILVSLASSARFVPSTLSSNRFFSTARYACALSWLSVASSETGSASCSIVSTSGEVAGLFF